MTTTVTALRSALRAVALMAFLLLLTPGAAGAAWTAPFNVSDVTGKVRYDPNVAVDSNGNAAFVWRARDNTADCDGNGCHRIQTRARSTAGVLSAIQTISAAGQNAFAPQVGVDQDGNAIFAWTRYDGTGDCFRLEGCLRTQIRTRSAAGILGTVQTISTSGEDAQNPQVAVDQGGDAAFTWYSYDGNRGHIKGRTRSAAGILSALQEVSGIRQVTADPDVAIDQAGNAVFTWTETDATTDCYVGSISVGCPRIKARVLSTTGVLSATQTLSAAGQRASLSHVGTDRAGDAVFIWLREDGTTDCRHNGQTSACARVQARVRSAGGALGATETLSGPGTYARMPELAVNQNGDAAFVWASGDHNTADCNFDYTEGCHRGRIRARSAAGAWSSIQTLSDPKTETYFPRVAIDEGGNSVVVWDSTAAGTTSFHAQARARSATGALSDIETFSKSTPNLQDPHVATSPGGVAVAAWALGTNGGIQAAAGP